MSGLGEPSRSSFDSFPWSAPEPSAAPWSAAIRHGLARHVQQRDLWLVAEDGKDGVVGLLILCNVRTSVVSMRLAVADSCRRRGIGSLLLRLATGERQALRSHV